MGAAGRADGFVAGASLAFPLWDRSLALGRIAQGLVDDVETLGQVVLESARVQGRRVERARNVIRAVVQLEMHGAAQRGQCQRRHHKEENPATALARQRHAHCGATITSSL